LNVRLSGVEAIFRHRSIWLIVSIIEIQPHNWLLLLNTDVSHMELHIPYCWYLMNCDMWNVNKPGSTYAWFKLLITSRLLPLPLFKISLAFHSCQTSSNILYLWALLNFLYFLLDQKVPKNQGLLKMAKNWRAIFAGRNEVEPLLPLL